MKILAKSPKKVSGEKVSKQDGKQGVPLKELVPSKSRVLKRLKKLSHKPQSSSEDQSSLVRKAQINRREVIIREIPAPVSLCSRKRRAEDVAKHIAEKRKKRKLVIHEESSDSEIFPETPLGSK
ncbi:unnamed protein product [Lactuca virosa]|uniref:Uncharacterized protein n=1 Tax=Lactuca virosa TaxID=75947 RepID=A0AAU9NSX2_9ASTR|nr:unnamed protein product [Lactuca virosa]